MKREPKKLSKSAILNHPLLKHSRFSKVNLIVFIITFAAIGAYVLLHSFAAGPSSFNCYGADQSCYSPATCTSTISSGLATAISSAADGSVICLSAAGSPYPTLSTSAVKNSDVIIQAAPGASVSIGDLNLTGTSHLVFQNLTSSGAAVYGTTHTHLNFITFTSPALVCTSTSCGAGVIANADVTFDHDRFDNIQTGVYEARLAIRGQNGNLTNSGVAVTNSHFGGTGLNGGWAGCSDGVGFVGDATGVTVGPGNEFDHLEEGNCVAINGAHVDPIQSYIGNNLTITGNYFHDNGDGTGGLGFFDGAGSSGGVPSVTFTNNVVVNSSYACEVDLSGAQGTMLSHNTFVNGAQYCFGKSNSCVDTTNNVFTNNLFFNGGGLGVVNHNSCSPGPSGAITATYNLNCGCSGSGNITGAPTFVGGASPTTYAGYALTSGSAGHNAASDGADMGINVFAGANLWVDTSGGSCTRQATVGAYADAQACGSLNAAYLAASPGDLIAIQPGSYGGQSIDDRTDLAIGSARITFCVASGDVTIDSGSVGGGALATTSHDLMISGAYCGTQGTPQTDHLTVTQTGGLASMSGPNGPDLRGLIFDNVHVNTVFMDSWGATLQYSEVGPTPGSVCAGGGQDDSIKVWWHGADETNPNRNSTVAYNYIHGNQCATGQHNDSIQAESTNLTVVGNRIIHCGQVFTESVSNSAVFGNYTGNVLRNNMIEEDPTLPPGQTNAAWCDQQTVSSGPPITYEYNTFSGWVTASSASSVVRGNIFLSQGSVGTADHNVVASGASGTDKACVPTLLSGSLWNASQIYNADFHLSPTDSCAKGAGNSASFPATDIDGDARSSPPWAGADEATGSGSTGDTTPPTVSMTAPSAGASLSGTSVTLSANAADNVAIAGVQFKVDGNNVGSEDTSSPYSISWNSQTVSNGSHTITAVARDTSGNTTTSTSVSVTVSNNTLIIGEPNILTNFDNGNGNLLLAQSATLSQSASIQSLSFYVTSAAGLLRLGIYDSTGPGGGPGALKAATAEITPVVGWNTAPTTTNPQLATGTYWLAYLPSSNSLAFVKNTDASSSGKLYGFTYGPLPSSFSTTPSSTTSHWSFYATLSLGTTPIPGDLNSDGHVTILDLSILLSHYGQSATASQGDINGDGTVTILDLSILLSHYGA